MAAAALSLTVNGLLEDDEIPTYYAVRYNQVDNRTQRTDWGLNIYWKVHDKEITVDGATETKKVLEVTTNVKNFKRLFDKDATYQDENMYQAWI